MQLGKALVGAIIGAALGIGLLVAVFLLFQLDAVWLSIPVALLTGLGVRMLVSTSGHASYARGALTGLLALAAYLGGWFVVKEVAQASANAPAKRPPPATQQADDEADENSDEPAEASTPPLVQPIVRDPRGGAALRKAPQPGQSTMDYIWLAIAGLVAYELGRGSGPKPIESTEPAPEEVPQGTHPDA
jgi:hypothetical protein